MPPALSPAALAAHDPEARVVTLDGATMGTRWTVKVAAPHRLNVAALERAIAARLAGIVAETSHWEPSSQLSGFNRARAGSWTVLPPDFATVMTAALTVAARSGGAYDPTLGRVVDLWGFGPVASEGPPIDRAVGEALGSAGWHRLDFDPAARRLRQPGGLSLDLSGTAKGFAVDAVADLLALQGLRHALIEIGGELVGRGVRPDGDPWWVELECPPAAGLAPFRVALHEQAIATSGDYVRGAHTLDPVTGRPLANGVRSVSVLHRSAMWADAWATALTVMGEDAGLTIAARERLAVRIVSRDQRGVRERLSPALAAML